MSRRRKWLAVSAKIVFVVTIVSACRTDPQVASETADVPSLPSESSEEEPDDLPPKIEVTRIVVETEVVEVNPSATPAPLKELVICIGQEPETLYPYGRSEPSDVTEHVLQGLYENMYTSLSYGYQARGLEKLPSLADGDAVLEQVMVAEGDTVLTSSGDVTRLIEGVRVRSADGQEVTFTGEPVAMTRMAVDFTLQPLVWSDGAPVTAEDSVYSFKLAADTNTPVPKRLIERTASYEATGDLTLRWTGVPGFLPVNYYTNIWTPYPRHYWGGYTAADLVTADESTRRPLSHGPYKLAEWVPGEQITLTRNEYYYRAGEGQPRIDAIHLMFVPNSRQVIARLLSGECDVGTHEALGRSDAQLLLDAEANSLLVPYFQTGTVFEHIDFGINPVEEYALTRPDWFQNPLVRQAITMCTDRQAMIDQVMFGRSELIHAYVPSNHPLYPADATQWPYDVAQANAILDSLGYLDSNEDGTREDPVSGAAFELTLLGALGNEVDERVAEIFQQDLVQCGIDVTISFIHSDDYFADGPDGKIFGRQFDLAAFPWLIGVEPNCALYLSSRAPGPENNWNRNYNNDTGFSNEAFDAACSRAMASLPGTAEYVQSHQEALRIWSEQLPIIPLFMRLKFAATTPEVVNFKIDPTQSSELWNLYEMDIE